MGARAARITREEFLTPPEFLGFRRADHQAARVGGARIELVRDADATRLGSCYQQVPVRLMPPFVLDSEPASLLYLINLTAGLLDGDGHLVEITARARTRTVVTGQSATRIHPAVASYATQQWAVEVEDDACLVVLPGPVIPFRGSRYYQRGRAELAPRAPADLGRHLAARPLRTWCPLGALPVRAYRPGLRGPSRWPARLSRPLLLGWPVDPGGRRLVQRRGTGVRQPDRLRSDARSPAGGRPNFPTLGFSARLGRDLRALVRPPVDGHRRPRAHRHARGCTLDRRARGSALASRLERSCPQPLVLDASGQIDGVREPRVACPFGNGRQNHGTPWDIARAWPVDVARLSWLERTAGGPGGCTPGRCDVGRAAPCPLDADFHGRCVSLRWRDGFPCSCSAGCSASSWMTAVRSLPLHVT